MNKYLNKRATMGYAQIFILVIATFAFAYIIYDSTKGVFAQEEEETIFPDYYTTVEVGSLAREIQSGYACCAETNSGNTCQYLPIEECNPDSQASPTQCENTNFCKLGCCISESNGWCGENTPKNICTGEWIEGSCSSLNQCERGCCVIGNNAIFTNEQTCNFLNGGEYSPVPIDFRGDIKTEPECLYVTERDDEGACVFQSSDETKCEFTTRETCISKTGSETSFYKDTFCSDENLNTSCVAHSNTGCVDEDQSVYWFDSCGNREDIFSYCNIYAGTICGEYRPGVDPVEPESGDYTCRDLSCVVDIQGKEVVKRNAESWCEYDGTIGDGKDVVGSRHVKHICYMGEERIEPCQDYRNEICIGTDTTLDTGETFTEAACRVNSWRSCVEYNQEGPGMAQKCEENPDCKIQHVGVDKFKFDVCVANYPPGFNLNTESGQSSARSLCDMGSQKCTVVYVKRFSGWKCEANCDCEKSGFTQQMNDLCTSLGDCGGYVNILGDKDDAYTSGAGKINLDQYKKYAQPNPNQEMAEPGSANFIRTLGYPGEEFEEEEAGGMFSSLGGGLGQLGVIMASGMAMSLAAEYGSLAKLGTGITQLVGDKAIVGTAGKTATNLAAQKGVESSGASIQAFGNVVAAVGAAWAIQSFLSVGFGMDTGMAWAIGIAAALLIWKIWGIGPLIWVGVILAIASFVFGWGKSKKKIIEFKCYPWEAPTGGANCDKCNPETELDTPCSDYRCGSLGQTCELINKNTDQQKCVDNSPNDVSSPKISPLEPIQEGYEYRNPQFGSFEIKTDQGGCIPEFTPIEFGIKTDKPAQCKIGSSVLQTYDEMENYFGGTNLYLDEHKNIMYMPSPAAFKNQYNLTDEQIASLGNLEFYVKCKSVNGVVNTAPFIIKTCVEPGPDLNVPVITKASPSNNAFVKYGATSQDLNIWVNEPANCSWSSEDKEYANMENTFNCEVDIEDYGLYGWPCNTTLTGVTNSSKFYIRCEDQPYAEILDDRNPMTQSYVYNLAVSNTPLKIKDFKPETGKKIIEGVEPVIFDLRVETTGGAENGVAECRWQGNSYSDFFTETFSNFHSYEVTGGTAGNYNIDFICEDVAGNIAEAETSFRISIDNLGPRIVRAYFDGGLKIVTTEEAECRYGFDRKFVYENATEMGGDGFSHTADWKLKTYYVQCADNFGNKGSKKQIKAYELL